MYQEVIISTNKPKTQFKKKQIKTKLFIGIKLYDVTFIYIFSAYPSIIVLIHAAQKLYLR